MTVTGEAVDTEMFGAGYAVTVEMLGEGEDDVDEGALDEVGGVGCAGAGAGGEGGVTVRTCVVMDGGAWEVMVVGDIDVTVRTTVEGVSGAGVAVTTIVERCVVIRVSVCVVASMTVVASVTVIASVTVVAATAPSPVLPPSTATTEYEAGARFSRNLGSSGQALERRRNEEREMVEQIVLGLISLKRLRGGVY